MFRSFQDLFQSLGAKFILLGKEGVKGLYALSGNILFWEFLAGLFVLLSLYLGILLFYSKRKISIRRLKRVNRLIKLQEVRAKLGIQDIDSSEFNERAKKSAILDLVDKGFLKLRENLQKLKRLDEDSSIGSARLYKKTQKKVKKLRSIFAGGIYASVSNGIAPPTDVSDEEYTNAISELKLKEKSKKEKQKPEKSKSPQPEEKKVEISSREKEEEK